MSDRFQVRSVTGWSIGPEGRRSTHYSTSYWVLDTAYHKNVSGDRFYSGTEFQRNQRFGPKRRRMMAESLARRLNRENERCLAGL